MPNKFHTSYNESNCEKFAPAGIFCRGLKNSCGRSSHSERTYVAKPRVSRTLRLPRFSRRRKIRQNLKPLYEAAFVRSGSTCAYSPIYHGLPDRHRRVMSTWRFASFDVKFRNRSAFEHSKISSNDSASCTSSQRMTAAAIVQSSSSHRYRTT